MKKAKNLHHYNYFLYLKIIANYRILRVTSKIVCSFLIVYCNELFHSQSLILNCIPISFTLDGGSISLLNCYLSIACDVDHELSRFDGQIYVKICNIRLLLLI